MGYKRSTKVTDREAQILKAIQALKDCEFPSTYAAARHFEFSQEKLRRRVVGGISQSQAFEIRQILSIPEERTLVR